MATKRQVVGALRKAFPDIDVAALDETAEKHILGIVVSRRFDELDYPERQKLIDRALRKALRADQLNNVGPIAALTPAEAEWRAADVY